MKKRVEYEKICIVCNKNYIAKRIDSKVCGNYCRNELSIKNKENKAAEIIIKEKGGIISEQDKRIVEMSNNFIKDTISEKIPALSQRVGKDLSECKRPDGKHLYTQTDLWICLAKIIRSVFQYDKNNPVTFLATIQPDEIIADFERRFECKFSDVKKSNPDVKPSDSDFLNSYIMSKYANLNYSK